MILRCCMILCYIAFLSPQLPSALKGRYPAVHPSGQQGMQVSGSCDLFHAYRWVLPSTCAVSSSFAVYHRVQCSLSTYTSSGLCCVHNTQPPIMHFPYAF